MNIYENYISELLNEDKPIGAKNRELWQNYLEKRYMSRDDIEDYFVTFVSEDKVGINPKSIWETPNGVYTYPVAWTLDNQIPFRGSKKPSKIKVLKRISDKVLSNKLSPKQYKEKIEHLKKEYGLSDKLVNGWSEDAKVETYFGKLWNVTRMIAKHLKNEKTSNIWSTILLHLGYDVVIDNGDGVIHSNEKTQTVFLSPKSYKVVDEEYVDTEVRYIKTNNVINHYRQFNEILSESTYEEALNYLETNFKNIFRYAEKDLVQFIHRLVQFLFDGAVHKIDINNIVTMYKQLFDRYFKSMAKDNLLIFTKPMYTMMDYFIQYFYDYYKDRIYHMFSHGNFDIFEFYSQSFIVELFNEVIEKLLKERNEEFLGNIKNFEGQGWYNIFLYHKDLLKKIFKETPDVFTKTQQEKLDK